MTVPKYLNKLESADRTGVERLRINITI